MRLLQRSERAQPKVAAVLSQRGPKSARVWLGVVLGLALAVALLGSWLGFILLQPSEQIILLSMPDGFYSPIYNTMRADSTSGTIWFMAYSSRLGGTYLLKAEARTRAVTPVIPLKGYYPAGGAIAIGKDGTVWFVLQGNGFPPRQHLAQYTPAAQRLHVLPLPAASRDTGKSAILDVQRYVTVQALVPDDQGNVWILRNGGSLLRFTSGSSAFSEIPLPGGIYSPSIVYKDGQLWFPSTRGLFSITVPAGEQQFYPWLVSSPSTGMATPGGWAASSPNGLVSGATGTNIFFGYPTLFQSSSTGFFLATSTQAYTIATPAAGGQAVAIPIAGVSSAPTASKTPRYLYRSSAAFDHRGGLWISSEQLTRLDLVTGKVKTYALPVTAPGQATWYTLLPAPLSRMAYQIEQLWLGVFQQRSSSPILVPMPASSSPACRTSSPYSCSPSRVFPQPIKPGATTSPSFRSTYALAIDGQDNIWMVTTSGLGVLPTPALDR